MRGEGSRWCLGSGAGLGVVALLLPKCPLCLAGYLAVIGVGATAGITIAEHAAPAAVVLAAALVTAAAIRSLHPSTRLDRAACHVQSTTSEPSGQVSEPSGSSHVPSFTVAHVQSMTSEPSGQVSAPSGSSQTSSFVVGQ